MYSTHIRGLTQEITDASGLSLIQQGLWSNKDHFFHLCFWQKQLLFAWGLQNRAGQLSAGNPEKGFEQADKWKGELPKLSFPIFRAVGSLDGDPPTLDSQRVRIPTHSPCCRSWRVVAVTVTVTCFPCLRMMLSDFVFWTYDFQTPFQKDTL